MRIRKKQIDELTDSSREAFVVRAVAHLRQGFPDRVPASSGELRGLVESGIEQARGFGILRELDVIRFLEILVAVSDDLDAEPWLGWTADVLGRDDLTGEEKITFVYAAARVEA